MQFGVRSLEFGVKKLQTSNSKLETKIGLFINFRFLR
jgi:hypothetical protein